LQKPLETHGNIKVLIPAHGDQYVEPNIVSIERVSSAPGGLYEISTTSPEMAVIID
jgi:hypothetical protein